MAGNCDGFGQRDMIDMPNSALAKKQRAKARCIFHSSGEGYLGVALPSFCKRKILSIHFLVGDAVGFISG